jgi:hypothetical protein
MCSCKLSDPDSIVTKRRYFLFATASRPELQPIANHIKCVSGIPSRGGKAAEMWRSEQERLDPQIRINDLMLS